MKRYPTTLIIAGSDSCGGAGIQADVKTCAALGVYAATAITAVTAQNSVGVRGVYAVSPEMVKAQIEAVMDDLVVDTVKVGMLCNAAIANVVADALERYANVPVILDPVMISTSRHKLLDDDAVAVVRHRLFPLATLVTPNCDEASMLAAVPVTNLDEMRVAADRLMEAGCKAVLVKGGHLQGAQSIDLLRSLSQPEQIFKAAFCHTDNTHGTGCTLSSAIAACMARGYELPSAVEAAKTYVTDAIKAGADVFAGHGHGAMNHAFSPLPLQASIEMKQ